MLRRWRLTSPAWLRLFSSARWTSTLVLRPYQEQCIQSCLSALDAGSTRIGVSSPTGSGKTTIFVTLLSRIKPPTERPEATRSLIVVNSVELARQAAENVRSLFPAMSVEIEQGQKSRATGFADVTVATYQTLLRPDRLRKFDPNGLKAIIIDEAHHAAAPSYLSILSYFDPMIKSPNEADESLPRADHPVPIIGFSATFSRHDGLALGSVFEQIVYHRDFVEMIDENWLCQVRFTSVKANIDLSNVTISGPTGDFSPTSLAQVINTEAINILIVQSWLDRASGTRKSTLVFCVNIAHVAALTNQFRSIGVDARFLHSKTPAFERKALLDAFRAGEFPVLVNCAILTEGADIPNIDCVIVAKPTRSRNVFAQMLGRGMRLSPSTGKTDCHVIDFVDSMSRVSGIVSAPTLFGLAPDTELDNVSLEELKTRETSASSTRQPEDIPTPTTVTYTDYDNPWSLKASGSGLSPSMAKLSQNAWVGCGKDVYVLECLGKGHIKLQHNEGEEAPWTATFTPAPLKRAHTSAIGLAPIFLKKRSVLTAETLEAAVRGCDTYASNKVVYGPMAKGLLRSARWRRDPATDGQKKFLKKRLKLDAPTLGLQGEQAKPKLNLETVTKGEAANIINRLAHGAQKYHEDVLKRRARVAKVEAKADKMRARETVSVGPLAATG